VSAAEFEQMKRDLEIEESPRRRTSTLTRRSPAPRAGRGAAPASPASPAEPAPPTTPVPPAQSAPPARPVPPAQPAPNADTADAGSGDGFQRAPDEAENDGMAAPQKPNRPKPKSRNRRHGRRR